MLQEWGSSTPCSAGGFSRIQPATTVFFSHAKSAQPPANQPANSIFLSREISQPSSQPASRTSRKAVNIYGFSKSRVQSSSKFQGCTLDMKLTSRYNIVECYGIIDSQYIYCSYHTVCCNEHFGCQNFFEPCKMMHQVNLTAVCLTAIHTPIKSPWHRNKTEFSSL